MVEVIYGLEPHIWKPFWPGTEWSERANSGKQEALRMTILTLLEEYIAASPPLSVKKLRAAKLCKQYAHGGNLAAAAKKAVRVGVSAQQLNSTAILLGK